MFRLFEKSLGPAIRHFGVEQGEACAAIHAASFAYPWPQGDIEALLIAPTTVADGAFGARTDDMQGFILARAAADEAEILTIAVTPRRRGRGIAGRLLDANMAALATLGVKSLFLEVEAENHAARALYKRHGFETVGERKAYYRKADGGMAMAYILRKTLP
jgi:ribosomal-protein-alanine N-acetyltransferase